MQFQHVKKVLKSVHRDLFMTKNPRSATAFFAPYGAWIGL